MSQVKPEIPAPMLARWQRLVDLMGRITDTPAALITRIKPRDIEMLVSSDTAGNPYCAHEESPRNCGLYCDRVIDTREPLLVTDAQLDKEWRDNPDMVLGLSFYLGYPLSWPDGEPFGTLCVLDVRHNLQAQQYKGLLEEFQLLVNGDLQFLFRQQQQRTEQQILEQALQQQRFEVRARANDLEEINTAMRVLLNQREQDKQALETEIYASIEHLLQPWLRKLESSGLTVEQQEYLGRIREQLGAVRHPKNTSLARLTPTEQQVAVAIGNGLSSKAIAQQMHLEKSTIDFHRRNIREKLGLARSSVTLKQYLLAASQ
ncbi:LuxR C-terminal-related transcriptional regulator [Aliamphritea hakodatensis]|uniref:LuxR C-terminal-related transcriptional regulator n=1 Tax=Aliamphritea hakodatensis TaxID=2895352 RepID=UPI0022FD8747|nr:LuxR C-terminal-related transcriptional regulator [Aliamphritea hakodatensis]